MTYKTLSDYDFAGKTVFVRADLNVPAKDGVITDTTRIDRFAPTARELADKGAKVVIASHFGRPKGQVKPEYSLAFMVPALEKAIGKDVIFFEDCIGEKRDMIVRGMENGDIILLENLRFYNGETENNPDFAGQLASEMDAYVNDAFSTAHRAHASTEGIAHLLPHFAGRLMQEELQALDKALGNPERPVAALVGGAKVSTKLDLLGNLVKKVDYLCISGGMAHTFLAAFGYEMGAGSLVEPDMVPTAKLIMENAGNCQIVVPADIVWADAFAENQTAFVSKANEVPTDKFLLDMGPKTVAAFIDVIKKSKTFIWNGPVGVFEMKPFDKATNDIAYAVQELTKSGNLISVAGGGDTVSALKAIHVDKDFTYISSAGGAFLEWMEGKSLPGVAALELPNE